MDLGHYKLKFLVLKLHQTQDKKDHFVYLKNFLDSIVHYKLDFYKNNYQANLNDNQHLHLLHLKSSYYQKISIRYQ